MAQTERLMLKHLLLLALLSASVLPGRAAPVKVFIAADPNRNGGAQAFCREKEVSSSSQSCRGNTNAETCWLIGEAMGHAC